MTSGRGRQFGMRAYLVLQAQTEKRWVAQTNELHCRVRYLRGSETVIEGRLKGINTVVIRLRASAAATVTTHWRFKDTTNGTVFAIKSIIPSHCGRWIDFTCETGVPT